MADPKVGYHIYWMIPAYYAMEFYDYIKESIRRRRVRKILKNPEIAKLSELAGIRKDEK